MDTKKSNVSRFIGLIALSLLAFTAFLDYTIVVTALPDIQNYFKLSVGELQWVITSYFLACSVAMVLMGRIGDRVGAKLWLLVMGLVFLLATIACALSSTNTMLIVARFFQGLGGAAIFPLCVTR